MSTGHHDHLTRNQCFAFGAVSGLVSRALVLPIDLGRAKGPAVAVARRGLHFGLVFSLYVPIHHTKHQGKRAGRKGPVQKYFDAFVSGGIATWFSRFSTNPIYRVFDAAARHKTSPQAAFHHVVEHQAGVIGLWQTMHPLIPAFLHGGLLFSTFEMGRRLADNNGYAPKDPLINAALGGFSAAVASTVAYPLSRIRYTNCVLNESFILRGLGPTLLKEVPMAACVFGVFTACVNATEPLVQGAGFGAWQ